MSGLRTVAARTAAALVLGTRWVLLVAVLYLSLHQWMREGYWGWSGLRQFGLPLLDPRIPAALVWWLTESLVLVLVVLPLAGWLASRIPDNRGGRLLAISMLAVGLGTRGVVGPLLMRSAFASPATFLSGGGEQLQSALTSPLTARLIVALTDSWWLLPALVLLVRLLGPNWAECRMKRWTVWAGIVGWVLVQPGDASYLLTAGGPGGATMNLSLLAMLEGFGRQELGYASVLGLFLGLASLPLGVLALRLAAEDPEADPGSHLGANGRPWLLLGALFALPLVLACLHNPPGAVPSLLASATGISVIASLVGAAWTVLLARALQPEGAQRRGKVREVLTTGPLLLPSLVLILPLIRPWGYQAGLVEVMVLLLGLIALAPYLGLAVLTFRLMNRRCAGWGGAWAAAAVVGWATWTDLSLPTLLSLRAHELVPLQGRVVWALSTQLWRSPLEVPGWPLAWLGGAIWAGLAVRAILGPVSPGPGFGTDRPQRRPARPGSE